MILSNKTREGAQNWRFVALRPFRHNMEVVENPFLSVGHDPLEGLRSGTQWGAELSGK